VDPKLTSLATILDRADARLRSPDSTVRIWPTGFPLLDDVLGGGLRAGALNILAGPQGQGKTTMALQMARNAVATGRAAIFFSFELDAEALLQRLISLEAGLIGGLNAPNLQRIRSAFEDNDGGIGGLPERLAGTAGIDALMRIQGYADRLVVHRSTTTQTDIPTIANAVKQVVGETGQPPLIIVDYLQKVMFDDSRLTEDESITKITEQLKDLAIDFEAPVFAIAAADKLGLEPGQRMRARHMRGGTALAYEPDVVLIMNTKSDVVARNHLLFDVNGLDRYREWTVITVEKNRQGHDAVELEFRKRFSQGRFETEGKIVAEQLVEERLFSD
jgi:replicative DNA helicase